VWGGGQWKQLIVPFAIVDEIRLNIQINRKRLIRYTIIVVVGNNILHKNI
jgi:hypothetical protein